MCGYRIQIYQMFSDVKDSRKLVPEQGVHLAVVGPDGGGDLLAGHSQPGRPDLPAWQDE
jgi:hypothetical protein